MPENNFLGILALFSIVAYYAIQVWYKRNNETTLAAFFIYIYLYIYLTSDYTTVLNGVILAVLFFIYISEEIFLLMLYTKKYFFFILGFYSIFFIYSMSILYVKETLPIIRFFEMQSLSGTYKNVLLSLLLYLFLPFVFRYVLLKRLHRLKQ